MGLAPFPHGTCALSVSETYVSLGGKHHLIHSTIPTTATHNSQTDTFLIIRTITGLVSLHRLSINNINISTLGTPQLSIKYTINSTIIEIQRETWTFRSPLLSPSHLLSFLPLLICLSSGSNPSQASAYDSTKHETARRSGNYVIRPPGDRSFAGLPRFSHSAAAFIVL